ncbi:Gfo/Idh/MocA family protein [Marinomonas mediterranea]|jgi:Predicted dehydrogenases and related proteins|uniref:Trans-1,2-dihydrobenzene-1,2-diol dehydrogenase n=1 Tax=Marinomonas mediterranea (strain ATCC 700492 / JCM 21426 / NBRC 103028 / MMB-1) TaxID=717774 RepID=F2K493_MARM1|nr:Gfo/Idh/MocA family oxidoreductase [Marinomonas mediterranea]ADZ92534.1 Trans-1,2-dihydrobenzene-1,2-diol dehydrogenase [Marinomonas mediterranea MMB-1]WCN10480.1 Gfo/Idh/MocA family oxidoreductase [Marinomonas mediterranea]WCN14528.1 Gfo/Idh/MocA family oxidoreductase [Marinomonas mediterranea]WCN18579.1 Gfo/Idh/MocA family oxidoreductase [Marinomonas mediterranea MMB-1]
MNEVRWGILGTGNIARTFANDFRHAKTGTLKAVASRNKDNADSFANDHDIELAMVDYYSLINSQEVDVVYIATPHSTHYELARAAILSGKAVLCEKPFTLNEAQAKELFELAEAHQVFMMEAMWTRFIPALEQAIEWIEEGEIGELLGIQASFNFKGPTDPEHRLLNPELGGGALLDVGIYPIFLAQLFLGRPDFVQNQVVIGDTDVDLFEQIMLGWESGQLASLEASILSPAPNRATLTGTQGYIEFGPEWYKSKSVRLIKADNSERAVEFDYEGEGYQFEVEEVNRCLIEGLLQSPNHSWQNTLNQLSTMDEIRQDMGVIYPEDGTSLDQDELDHHHHEHHHHKH